MDRPTAAANVARVAGAARSSCLNENEILALLHEAPAESGPTDARSHIDTCPACQELLACLVQGSGAEAPRSVGPRSVEERPSSSDLSGRSVGRYRISERLGAGAMGVVYLAEDPQLHRTVAVKVHQRRGDADAARLLREARALARLSHPNVIVVHEVDTFEGDVFMAMEFVDGGSLRSWLEAGERSTGEILDMFTQAARGLAGAHAAGIVHRDFKPDNVLVGRDGRVRVVDFGLAREDSLESLEASVAAIDPLAITRPNATALTHTGAIVGTPAYMSPEQWAGHRADARSDQFAFAVALFEALYGQRPFIGDTFAVLARAVSSGEIVVPRRSRKIPKPMAKALLRALRPDPADRFPSMDALLQALTQPPRTTRKVTIAVGAAITVGAAVVLGGRAFTAWKAETTHVTMISYEEPDETIARPASETPTTPIATTAAAPIATTPAASTATTPPLVPSETDAAKADEDAKPPVRAARPAPRANGKVNTDRSRRPTTGATSPERAAPTAAPEDLFDSIH